MAFGATPYALIMGARALSKWLDNERKRKEEQTQPANRDTSSRNPTGSQSKANQS